MPTYEYFCEKCDDSFEAIQKFSDAPLTSCPTGHEGVRRVIRPAGIIFKGSGWYIKDSKGSSTVSSASSKDDAAKSESKSEAKSDTKSDASGTSESKSSVSSEAA